MKANIVNIKYIIFVILSILILPLSAQDIKRTYNKTKDGFEYCEVRYNSDFTYSIEDKNGKIIIPRLPKGYTVIARDGSFCVFKRATVNYIGKETTGYPSVRYYTYAGDKIFDAEEKGFVCAELELDRDGVFWVVAYKNKLQYVIDINGHNYFPPFKEETNTFFDSESGKLYYYGKKDQTYYSKRKVATHATFKYKDGICEFAFNDDFEEDNNIENLSIKKPVVSHQQDHSHSRAERIGAFFQAFSESLSEGLATLNNMNAAKASEQARTYNTEDISQTTDFETKFKRDFIEYYIQQTGSIPSEKVVNEIWHQYLESAEDDEVDYDQLRRERHNKITQKTIEHKKNRYGYKKCHDCGGSGDCSVCHAKKIYLTGSGYAECYHCMLDSSNKRTGKCPRCLGKGQIYGIVNP